MQDIRDYPGEHSVARSPYSRAGASKSYHSSSPSPQGVFRDDNDDEREASITGSAHQSSDPDEAVFEATSQHSSPGTSHHSDDDEMSEFPPDLPVAEANMEHQQHFSSPYTPHKIRSPFRNPSSVRAMQMDTTPPHLTSSPSSQRYGRSAPSRNGTLRSMRSSHSAIRSPSTLSPMKKLKKEYPLVLLHVTLLPIPIPYSPAVMESVLPHYILENWKLLRQKATQTVLDRGILIPHPKEDYDLLEERLLESLELKTPRILKCGHFHLSPEEEADIAQSDGFESDEDEDTDADICQDCGRRIRDGRWGSGTGSKRWDIKLFAANGLMRAGAWGAAWREMERVDVEIVPWMDEDLKRQVELRSLEEAEAEAAVNNHRHRTRTGTGTGGDGAPNVSPGMDEARMREIYGDNIAQAFNIIDEVHLDEDENPTAYAYPSTSSPFSQQQQQQQQQTPQANQHHQQPPPHPHPRPRPEEIPLPTLLRNYIYILLSAQDGRNLAIVFLSFLVLLLALRSFTYPSPTPAPMAMPMWRYDDAKEWHRSAKGFGEMRDQTNDAGMSVVEGYVPHTTTGLGLVEGSVSVAMASASALPASEAASGSESRLVADDELVIPVSRDIPNPNPELELELVPEAGTGPSGSAGSVDAGLGIGEGQGRGRGRD